MTQVDRKFSRRIVVAPLIAPLVTVGALLAALGCDYQRLPVVEGTSSGPVGLGALCSLDESSATSVSIDGQSSTCPSHICLRPAEGKTTDTAALCTQVCQSDSDCGGGASRDPQSAMDQRCQTGFTCQAVVPNLASVPYSCQKLCVCKDFINSTQPATPPAGCP